MQTIFIHGSGTNSLFWSPQLARFPGAVALDLPGHPEGSCCASIDDYADWISESQDGQQLVLIGHSLGGAIALGFALRHSEKTAGLVLISSGARLRVHDRFLDGLASGDRDFHLNFLEQLHLRVPPPLGQQLVQRSMALGAGVMLSDLSACNAFDVMGRLGEVSAPVLVICGADDPMTPPRYAHHLANTVPDGRCVIVPEGAHLLPAEKPEAVNAAVSAFLEEIESR